MFYLLKIIFIIVMLESFVSQVLHLFLQTLQKMKQSKNNILNK